MKNQYIPIEKVLCIVPGNRDKDENMRFFGKKWCQASYTVEAAFTVPLGFLVLFSLSVLFTLLIKGNKVQMSLLHTVQTYAVTGSKMSSAAGVLEQGVLVRWKEQEGTNYCYTGYSESVPFLGSRFFRLHRYQQMAVTDYSGCSMVSDEVADYFVYIAENGKVFHRDRECTYLRIGIQESTPYVLENKRNQSGGIYYPCESCCHAEAQPSAAMVYFTSYGDRYHIRKECSKLKRNVRAVRRSKAGNLSPCSKCGGGE